MQTRSATVPAIKYTQKDFSRLDVLKKEILPERPLRSRVKTLTKNCSLSQKIPGGIP